MNTSSSPTSSGCCKGLWWWGGNVTASPVKKEIFIFNTLYKTTENTQTKIP